MFSNNNRFKRTTAGKKTLLSSHLHYEIVSFSNATFSTIFKKMAFHLLGYFLPSGSDSEISVNINKQVGKLSALDNLQPSTYTAPKG